MIKKTATFIKEKVVGIVGSFTGITSILGSYQLCHNICIGLIALLSVIGITISGMPLFFFTKIAKPFWIAAVVLLLISGIIYFKKKCISRNLLIMNIGLIIAGVPFQPMQQYAIYLWVIGGIIVVVSIGLMIHAKMNKGCAPCKS